MRVGVVDHCRRWRAWDLDVHRGETGDIRKTGAHTVNHWSTINKELSCSGVYQGVEEVITSI